jgi:glutamyl-tRNA synthetase/glutamyl-Q tRNA(Asp) synthetase
MVTRFAPSPTGYLHLGHVVNAIYVWGMARAAAGRVLLRIEDHDRIRSRPEYEAAILEDLAWLGFEPDEGLRPLVRQSDRYRLYEAALAQLRRSHRVYACDCSRKRIAGDRYDGFCRDRGLDERPDVGLRVQMDDGGDLLLRDRDGNWTYQFAVTVDDLQQRITQVIRGEDLRSSTDRQVRLRGMLGATDAPVFVHHALLVNADGQKLSKSNADTGVRELRAAGMPAREVIGRAAAAVGLLDSPRALAAHDVIFAAAAAGEEPVLRQLPQDP